MQRTLIVMRHAKSAWDNQQLSDFDRPLNARGRRAAPRMAQQLTEYGWLPEVILASSAERVRETLKLMLPEWPVRPEVFYERSLYLASRDNLLGHLRGLHASWQTVMLVGHNPGLSELVSAMSGESMELPTAAVVVLQSMQQPAWAGAVGSNEWHRLAYWRPKELEDTAH